MLSSGVEGPHWRASVVFICLPQVFSVLQTEIYTTV